MDSEPSDYERLVKPIEAQMMRCVWRIVQNAADADDAFQDAVTVIWKQLPRIRAHPNPQALILRICSNSACDVSRRRSRLRKRERSIKDADESTTTEFDVGLLSREERASQLRRALAQLPERQATAITMRYFLTCSYEDIAAALGCSIATARVHTARGLARLRSLLPQFDCEQENQL